MTEIREGKLTRIPRLTLVELILGFVEYAAEEGRLSFPPLHTAGTRPWHKLMYLLSGLKNEFPVLECISGFDWDGIHPKTKGWEDVVNAVTVTRCICGPRAGSSRMFFYEDKRRPTNPLYHDYPELAEEMLKLALAMEDFFERLDIEA